uniref:Uncharacterized protein n=1 Tax=Graphocephala atropunctata TaxID=36148 RepID=A0A1B6L9J6_9HEMI
MILYLLLFISVIMAVSNLTGSSTFKTASENDELALKNEGLESTFDYDSGNTDPDKHDVIHYECTSEKDMPCKQLANYYARGNAQNKVPDNTNRKEKQSNSKDKVIEPNPKLTTMKTTSKHNPEVMMIQSIPTTMKSKYEPTVITQYNRYPLWFQNILDFKTRLLEKTFNFVRQMVARTPQNY